MALKISFFKGKGNPMKYDKFHVPMGTLYHHTTADVDFDPGDGKVRRIYATYRLLTTPFFSVRLESIPHVS